MKATVRMGILSFALVILLMTGLSPSWAGINDGLVAYYPFNGNANDESGNGHNGTVYSATLTTDRFGNPNSAYSFNGIGNYIKASASGLPTGTRTVSLWFYANTIVNHPELMGYGGGAYATTWFMSINSTNIPGSILLESHWDVNRLDYFYNQPPVGAWYHLVATTDINGTKIYVNGELKASNNIYINNTIVDGKDLAIGSITDTSGFAPYTDVNVSFFDGKIDDVRIYNRALSTSEIQELYTGAEIPDMSQWVGKWFSYTMTIKAIAFDGVNFTKGGSKESGFFKIWAWDGVNFQIDAYYLEGGVWKTNAQTLKFFAGNDLAFLFVVQNGTDEFGSKIAALMQGKAKNEILSSATITTYGGIVLDTDNKDNVVGAGSISFAAKMVAESKVKVPSNVVQH